METRTFASVAAAALLKINDVSALPTAETALTQGDPNASFETLQNLRVAIAEGGRKRSSCRIPRAARQ
jgi:hypothetical protein